MGLLLGQTGRRGSRLPKAHKHAFINRCLKRAVIKGQLIQVHIDTSHLVLSGVLFSRKFLIFLLNLGKIQKFYCILKVGRVHHI